MTNEDLLNKIGSYYVSKLRSNIKSDAGKSTGKLGRSIYYRVNGNELIIGSTYANDLGLLGLSEGRRPSKKNPSRTMVTAVVDWMKAKGMRPLSRQRRGRFRKQTEATYRKAAWNVSRSMLRKGYKGSRVIERSYRQLEKKIDKDILDHFNMAIEENLKNITIK